MSGTAGRIAASGLAVKGSNGPSLLGVAETGGQNAATDLTAAVSPNYKNSAVQLKSAIMVEPKTFNNCLGLEQGLWQRKMIRSVTVPKRSVFGL